MKVDFGYGPYEYGSIRGVHHAYAMVSDCCEAEVYKIHEDNVPLFSVRGL